MRVRVLLEDDIVSVQVWEPGLDRWEVTHERRANLADQSGDAHWAGCCVEELIREAEIGGY
jgi:hypothetical protein